jgi:hypothetical protein
MVDVTPDHRRCRFGATTKIARGSTRLMRR